MEELPIVLPELETDLKRAIVTAWEKPDLPAHLESLALASAHLAGAFIRLGAESYAGLSAKAPGTADEKKVYYLINFMWADQAKAFLILWRDVLFQQQKAWLMQQDGMVTPETMARLHEQSRVTLQAASRQLLETLPAAARISRRARPGADRWIKQWEKQQNPWPIYEEQMELIPGQCRQLAADGRNLEAVGAILRQIRQAIHQAVHECRAGMERTKGFIRQMIDEITTENAGSPDRRLSRIATRIAEVEAQLQHIYHADIFTNRLEQSLGALPEKMQVPVQVREGWLELSEIAIRRRARQWLESEIIPLLYEVWELTGQVDNGMKMTLVNIRNRASLLQGGAREGKTPEFEEADLSQPLHTLLRDLEHSEKALDELHSLVRSRLKTDFKLALAFDTTRGFLPLPLQSTIHQLRKRQGRLQKLFRSWLDSQLGRIRRFRRSVEKEEKLTQSEKVVRYLRSRMPDPGNSHYAGIFLTKGSIGESFWVGRREELDHLQTLVDNWQNGFRGAVLITGRRFSGKSLFGEMVANRHFPENTIRIQPAATVEIQGRKMEAGYDLAPVLEFIRKYTFNDRPLIWIDDLESWWDTSVPLSRNVRALHRAIDQYAGNMFFMVSMSNWLKAHLRRWFDIDRIFQAEINMDRMPVQDIRDAILIRHGATHKQLVNEKGEPVTPPQFKRMTDRVARAAAGNIGEALNLWSFSICKQDEERVLFRPGDRFFLPDFLNPDNAILLAVIMMQKRTNEYRLRKLFGPPFGHKYASILQRLISVGVLRRQLDGWLEVNELAANALAELLEQKRYLTFRPWKPS